MNCATPGVTTDRCYTGYWTGVTWALRNELCYTRCYHRQVLYHTGYWTGVTWALRNELCYTRCYHRQVLYHTGYWTGVTWALRNELCYTRCYHRQVLYHTGYWTGVTWALRNELCYTRCYHRQVFFPGVLHSRFDVQHCLTAVFSILRFLIPLRKQERGNTSIIRAKLAGWEQLKCVCTLPGG